MRTSVALEIPVAKTGVTAIEGPNAAGKSVLLAAAAGILRLEQVRVVGLSDPDSPPILCSQYPELEIFEEKAGDEVVYAAVSRGVPRALALERAASLVVLDEPTVGLDSRRRLALAGLVEELSRRSTFLLASQDGAWLDGFAARRHRLGGPTLPSGANPGKKRIDKALS